MTARRLRASICLVAAVPALGLAACGGGYGGSSGGSSSASVGDCIDSSNQVVDCSSSSATKKLVSDQSKPNAIACVQIGSKPQTEVKAGGGTFCAEDLK